MAERLRLGDLLVKAGAISEDQLRQALEEQRVTHARLGEVLVKNAWVSERQLVEALADQLKKGIVTLSRFKPMPEALRLVPEQTAKRLEIVPMSVNESGQLLVAIADPLNVFVLDELRMLTGMEVDVSLAVPSEIRRSLDSVYRVPAEGLDEGKIEIMEEAVEDELDSMLSTSDAASDDAPVVKLVNSMIEQSVKEGTSDIHIEPQERKTRVRYRVDGSLFDAFEFSRRMHPAVSSRIKIMAGMDIAEKRKPQDGRILIKVLGRRVDFRVSSLPTVFGEKIVIRVLDQSAVMVGLDKIGFEAEDKALLEDILKVPYGIILITGPTGSGKSTTLYSMLEKINRPEVNIITVEDPVEYHIPGINQVQVNEKAGLTFAESLRSILRQDPDKIMLGEIRDTVTAEMAIRAALTGHTVLSTLHTNDAPSSIIRLSDMGVAPFLVSSSMMAAIAQRLVRRLCNQCKEPYPLPQALCDTLGFPEGTVVYRPVGCDACRNSGFKGRTAIFEIMVVNDEIRTLIVRGAPLAEIRALALREGMRSLRDQGLRKVKSGVSSLEEVLFVTMG